MGQVEACIKFVKKTMRNCYETNADMYMSLKQTGQHQLAQDYQALSCFCLTDCQKAYCQDAADHPSCDNNGSNHASLRNRQHQSKKRYIYIFLTYSNNCSSTVWGWGPWMHGIIIGDRSEDHDRRCKGWEWWRQDTPQQEPSSICQLLPHSQKITSEMMYWKATTTDKKLNELRDRFAKIHNDEIINKTEMEKYRGKGNTTSSKYGCRM